jgi:hypothetical protein
MISGLRSFDGPILWLILSCLGMGKCWGKKAMDESVAPTDKLKVMLDEDGEDQSEMEEYVKVKKPKKALLAVV